MRFSYEIFLLVLLGPLSCQSVGGESTTKQNGVTGNIREILIREKVQLTIATRPKHDAEQSDSDIVSQIIGLLNCGPFPHSPNSHLEYSLDYTKNGLRLYQACDRYYKTTKSRTSLRVQCKFKTWIFNKIDCRIITCPPLTAPPDGHISTTQNTYNTTVYFWCSSGFNIIGTVELLCEETGLWNLPVPTCQVSYCRPLSSPRYGFVLNQEEVATNQTVEFKCEREYSLIGDAVLRCQDDGRWNTTAPACRKMCIVPNMTNQSDDLRLITESKKLSIGSLIEPGQRIIFSCKPGYMTLSGSSICIEGTWKPPIHCREGCAAVEIANGKYTLSKDASTIEYTCLPEYQLVGQQKLSCTANRTWDRETPVCRGPCELSDVYEVLSYRRKKTYEIIPFGTRIMNGVQVNSICRSGSSMVTECLNEKLSPYPCISRVESGVLEIWENQRWHKICDRTADVCAAFGYKKIDRVNCGRCYQLDLEVYLRTSRILLGQEYRDWFSTLKCLRCN